MRLSDSEKLKNKRVQNTISANTRLTEHKTKLDSLSKKRDELEELMPRLSATIKGSYSEMIFYSIDHVLIKICSR